MTRVITKRDQGATTAEIKKNQTTTAITTATATTAALAKITTPGAAALFNCSFGLFGSIILILMTQQSFISGGDRTGRTPVHTIRIEHRL